MSSATHIFVTAPHGRVTPIHHEDGIEPGGAQMLVRHGEIRIVRYWIGEGRTSQTVRRSIRRGDLIPCNMDGATVDSFDAAAVPEHQMDNVRRVIAKKGTES